MTGVRSICFCKLTIVALMAVLGSTMGCRDRSSSEVLRLAHTLDTSHPVHAAMEHMAAELAKSSSGRLQIKIYPGGQLVSERETIELLQLGAIDMVKTSAAPLEGFIPGMAVFGIPYVFLDDAHFWKRKTQETLDTLVKNGVEVIHPDKRPFQEAVKKLHDSFKGTEAGRWMEAVLKQN